VSAIRRFAARLINLILPRRAERALARELSAHLALLEDEYRRAGQSPDAARRSARQALGGVEQTKELHRDSRNFAWVGDVRRDVVYALRLFRRRPVTATAAILSLGLGIGLNAAVFTIFDWVLLRPLPYGAPQQLVRVLTTGTAPATAPVGLALAEFRVLAGATSLGPSAAFSTATRVLRAPDIEPFHVVVARVDGDLFGTLGIVPVLGRSFRAEEVAAGATVVVLSHELWRSRFHEDTSLLNGTIGIDGVPHTVVGVAPPNRRYPSEADLWRPLLTREKGGSDRELVMIARLSSDATIARANAELATLARAASNGARTAWADQLQRTDVRDVRSALNALLASTLLVLLIVCANVAALLGSRARDRIGEMALRGALGASRRQLFLQLTTEGLVTAVLGGVVGVVIGALALRVLVAIAPVGVPRLSEAAMDMPLFVTTFGVTAVIGLCVGLGPALRLSRESSGALALAAWHRATGLSRARRLLVLSQIALAVMLTAGAGLLARSLRNLVSVSNGFDVDHVVAVDLDLRGSDTTDTRPLFRNLVAAAETLPGVQAAAVSLQLPTQVAGLRAQVQIAGAPEVQTAAVLRLITPRYFDTLGVSLTGGRSFAESDTATTPYVAIVNAGFVRDILRGNTAIGVQLTSPLIKQPVTVVGTVPDLSPGGESDRPALYVSANQVVPGAGFLLVRVVGDPRAARSLIASRARKIAPTLPIDRVRPLAELLEPARAMTRFNTRLVTTFAALALLLSVIGVYGLTAGEVAARWRELAVRMMLGASPRGVLWTVMRPCAAIILAGSAVGVAGALAVGPLLGSLLHGIDPADIRMLAAAPVVLIAIGILAAVLASARVLWAEPADTLRSG
jgi:putative ABC transport system permease protein